MQSAASRASAAAGLPEPHSAAAPLEAICRRGARISDIDSRGAPARYGPDAIVSVTVPVYVPTKVLAGVRIHQSNARVTSSVPVALFAV